MTKDPLQILADDRRATVRTASITTISILAVLIIVTGYAITKLIG